MEKQLLPLETGRINLLDLTLVQLTELVAAWGQPAYRAKQVWEWMYHRYAADFAAMSNLPRALRDRLAAETTLSIGEIVLDQHSNDGQTEKVLFQLPDGQFIETVLMRYEKRRTLCISTQAGCAMGCVFCATGQMGFMRHLTVAEIVGQVLHFARVLAATEEHVTNIVMMGMGEPLHNYNHTMTALDILMDHKGLSIAPKHITLSTVGLVPGIIRLADEARPFRLAVSLHGATDAERQALVPPARRWPLADLMDACRYYIAKRQRRIFFEWTLIEGQNDTPAQAHALGQLLTGLEAHVNLIPLNPTTGYTGQPTEETAVKTFQSILTAYNLPSTVRQRRGIDIAAGCGQLKAITQ